MMNKCGSTPPRPPWWCPWSRSFSGGFFCVKADEIENQSFLTHEAIVHCAGQEWHDWHEHDWHAWQLDCAGTSSCSTGQRFVGGHPPLMPTPRFGRSEVKPKTWINLGRDFMYTIIYHQFNIAKAMASCSQTSRKCVFSLYSIDIAVSTTSRNTFTEIYKMAPTMHCSLHFGTCDNPRRNCEDHWPQSHSSQANSAQTAQGRQPQSWSFYPFPPGQTQLYPRPGAS